MGGPPDVFSYGGGVQSNAALVLAAQRQIPYRVFLWSNVGDDSERPETIEYVRNVAMPYAAAHDLELIELRREYIDGRPYATIYEIETDLSKPAFYIPLRGADGGPLKRQCTDSWKIEVIGRWLKQHGAVRPCSGGGELSVGTGRVACPVCGSDQPVTKAGRVAKHRRLIPTNVGVGFSLDEVERVRVPDGSADPRNPEQLKRYPLLDLGIRRSDCYRIIEQAGLPEPPKSSCYFCPFHSDEAWVELKKEQPVLFRQAVEVERSANIKLERRGRGDRPVFLTRYGRPLDDVVADLESQGSLFAASGPESCDSGHCWT